RRAAADRRAVRPRERGEVGVLDSKRGLGDQRSLPAGEPLRAPAEEAPRGLPAGPDAERTVPALRNVPPVQLRRGERAANLEGFRARARAGAAAAVARPAPARRFARAQVARGP